MTDRYPMTKCQQPCPMTLGICTIFFTIRTEIKTGLADMPLSLFDETHGWHSTDSPMLETALTEAIWANWTRERSGQKGINSTQTLPELIFYPGAWAS